jgi:hypothetical protein
VATWSELVRFIRSEYRVVRDDPEEIRIRLTYRLDEDTEPRAQTVVIAHEVLDRKEDWVQIASPFAKVEDVNLEAVLEYIGRTTVVGAAVIMGEHLTLRHSLPLVNLDINEFVDPLELVAGSAEYLEQQITGRDEY